MKYGTDPSGLFELREREKDTAGRITGDVVLACSPRGILCFPVSLSLSSLHSRRISPRAGDPIPRDAARIPRVRHDSAGCDSAIKLGSTFRRRDTFFRRKISPRIYLARDLSPGRGDGN